MRLLNLLLKFTNLNCTQILDSVKIYVETFENDITEERIETYFKLYCRSSPQSVSESAKLRKDKHYDAIFYDVTGCCRVGILKGCQGTLFNCFKGALLRQMPTGVTPIVLLNTETSSLLSWAMCPKKAEFCNMIIMSMEG